MLSSGKLAPAFKVYLKMRENTRSNIRYHANRMTSLLSSELPFQTKFPCENSRVIGPVLFPAVSSRKRPAQALR